MTKSVSPEEFDHATDGWATFEDFFPVPLDNPAESE